MAIQSALKTSQIKGRHPKADPYNQAMPPKEHGKECFKQIRIMINEEVMKDIRR